MAQQSALRELDALIFSALEGTAAGGDAATLHRKDRTTVACSVYIEENVERFGNESQVVTVPAVIHCFKSEIATQPQKGEWFELEDGRLWTVDVREAEDVSRWALRCKVGQ